MTPERAEAARLLRDLGRDAKTIAANITELSITEAETFIRTGKLPANDRQLRLFGAANDPPKMTETPSGGKPLGPLVAFARPKERTTE